MGLSDKANVKLGSNFRVREEHELYLLPMTDMDIESYFARDNMMRDFLDNNFSGKKYSRDFEFDYDNYKKIMKTIVIVSDNEIELETIKKRTDMNYVFY